MGKGSCEAVNCPECSDAASRPVATCPTCGAPPILRGRTAGADEEVRTQDLEPYVTLRYIARLFKVLAVLMMLMLIGEVIMGLMTEGRRALPDAHRRRRAAARDGRADVGWRRHHPAAHRRRPRPPRVAHSPRPHQRGAASRRAMLNAEIT